MQIPVDNQYPTSNSFVSLREAVFAACRTMWRSPEWPQIHNLVRTFHSVRDEDRQTSRDRSWIGRAAANIAPRTQVLAYLLIDREHANITEGPFDTPVSPSLDAPLHDDERRLLWLYQHQIAELNTACMAPLIDALPNLRPLIDPLGGYIFEMPAKDESEPLISSDSLEAIVCHFHLHPAFRIIQKESHAVLSALDSDFYNQHMIPLWRRIQEVGPLDAPHELRDLFFATSPLHPNRRAIRLVIALLAIRESLLNVNQVLFQSLHSQKLAMFTEKNLVDVESNNSNLVGRGLELTFVAGAQSFNLNTGDFVGFKIPRDQDIHNLFATVYWHGMTMAKDVGWLGQVKLRGVDDFLNPYSLILESI